MASDSRKDAVVPQYNFHRLHSTLNEKPEPTKQRKKSGIFAVLTMPSRRSS